MHTPPSPGPQSTSAGTDVSVRSAPSPIAPRPRVASADILRGNAEVEIEHRGTLYRLRVTSLGKLILTK